MAKGYLFTVDNSGFPQGCPQGQESTPGKEVLPLPKAESTGRNSSN